MIHLILCINISPSFNKDLTFFLPVAVDAVHQGRALTLQNNQNKKKIEKL